MTVLVTLRPLELEGQLDELDRGLLLGAVLFSLLGGALGYWMAERIADPVNGSHAPRGDCARRVDARVAATSADELGVSSAISTRWRLICSASAASSNARSGSRRGRYGTSGGSRYQEPLTLIQLSAEHARRVNIDSGRPLSPVLDECITVILSQVRLLRQIAAEFSSLPSSPTPHPEPTVLSVLVDEVVAAYRMALADGSRST